MPRRHILIVDHEREFSNRVSGMLQTRGYIVEVAYTGEEALKKARPSIDLILLDLLLPDMEGFEVCQRLREDPFNRHIPIIMTSSKSLFQDKIEGFNLGAEDYLIKPFEFEELFARMEAVLRRSIFHQLDAFPIVKEELVRELRKILNQELIVPYFQPIYYLKPLSLCGMEVLSRSNTMTILSDPDLMFKAAIKFGFYHDLEMLAWRKALQVLTTQITQEKIFLNCNPYLVEGPKFLQIKRIFEENNIQGKNVVLEITERSDIRDLKIFYNHLQRYRDFGFQIAVDDVGGGYASLESIVETRPEVVKIDPHIIRDLKMDAYKRSIVKFVVLFCRENHIISIAEGIETREDLMMATEIGVDAGQGYYLLRPTSTLNITQMKERIQQLE